MYVLKGQDMVKLSDWIRRKRPTVCSAVVVAAGSSRRMGEDKLKMRLGGMPVLARTLKALQQSDTVGEIVVVTRVDKLEETALLCRDYGITKAKKVVAGGESRTESALAGLMAVDKHSKLVMIHDGARPLVREETIRAAAHAAALYGCAAPAVPVTDTVKLREGDKVKATLPRSELAAMQTPQVFESTIIKTALTKALTEGKEYTDDCAAVEALGFPVRLTEGDGENIKITSPLDIARAELIIREREAGV